MISGIQHMMTLHLTKEVIMEKYYYHVVTERPMQLHQVIKFDANNNQSGVYKRVMDK